MENNQGNDLADSDLCIHCLEPVGHNANFCIHCRAPLGFLAGTVSYYSVFAEGFIMRAAVTRPRNLTTVMGVWVIFGNYLIMGVALLWATLSASPVLRESWVSYYLSAMYLGMVLVGASGVVRCTRNFASYKPVVSVDEG